MTTPAPQTAPRTVPLRHLVTDWFDGETVCPLAEWPDSHTIAGREMAVWAQDALNALIQQVGALDALGAVVTHVEQSRVPTTGRHLLDRLTVPDPRNDSYPALRDALDAENDARLRTLVQVTRAYVAQVKEVGLAESAAAQALDDLANHWENCIGAEYSGSVPTLVNDVREAAAALTHMADELAQKLAVNADAKPSEAS